MTQSTRKDVVVWQTVNIRYNGPLTGVASVVVQ
jgi:hypothetical protein